MKFLVLSISIFLLFVNVAFAEFNPFPKNTQSNFAYNDNDIPDICFFPADEARWNGLSVTAKEWSMLTDFQKAMFISEYVGELEKARNIVIEINGWDYLVLLNKFVSECQGDCLNSPMILAVEAILVNQGKIKERTTEGALIR